MFYANFLSLCVFVDNWPVDCLTLFFAPSFVYKIRVYVIQMHTLIIVYPVFFFNFLLAVNSFRLFIFFVAFPNNTSHIRKKNFIRTRNLTEKKKVQHI